MVTLAWSCTLASSSYRSSSCKDQVFSPLVSLIFKSKVKFKSENTTTHTAQLSLSCTLYLSSWYSATRHISSVVTQTKTRKQSTKHTVRLPILTQLNKARSAIPDPQGHHNKTRVSEIKSRRVASGRVSQYRHAVLDVTARLC